MSTKFSTRPAVRKRPWICKRSPPCLIPAPFPPSLIATFSLTYNPPVGPQAYACGSLLLPWLPIPALYSGTWTYGADWYDCTFHRDLVTGASFASANWAVSGNLDTGNYPTQELLGNPMPAYIVATLAFFDATWLVRLTITG